MCGYQTTLKSSVLKTALQNNKLNVVKILIEIMSKEDFLREDLLHAICGVEDPELLLLLWDKGIDLNQRISTCNGNYSEDYNFGEKLFFKACLKGDVELIRLLLQKGVDLDKYTTQAGYGGNQSFRYHVLHTLQGVSHKLDNNDALVEFNRSYRCNGREPVKLPLARTLLC